MSRSATVLGCALALTVGIQVAEASSCIDHQLVDKLGQIVRDANGNAVAMRRSIQIAGDPESVRWRSRALFGRRNVVGRRRHRGGAGDL